MHIVAPSQSVGCARRAGTGTFGANLVVVRVRALAQVAGKDTTSDQLNAFLREPEHTEFRFLLAYVRWSGLHLIDAELQSFASRGRVDGIVSIDFGGTTVEALTYLSELPNSRVRIFEAGLPDV